jgi:hypothetical protein
MVAKSVVRSDGLHWMRYVDDILLGYILVRAPGIRPVVYR